MTRKATQIDLEVKLGDNTLMSIAQAIQIFHSWAVQTPGIEGVDERLTYLADLFYYSHLHSTNLHGRTMREIKRHIRNFRISETLNQKLKDAAELVGADPSALLRDFVRDGTSRIISDDNAREEFRQRYA